MGDFKRVHIQAIGDDESYGAKYRSSTHRTRECVLWIAVEHEQKEALGIFAREIAPAGTGMAPGLCGLAGGRPNVAPVLKHFSFGIDRQLVKPHVRVVDANDSVVETVIEHKSHNYFENTTPTKADSVEQKQSFSGPTVPLEQVALARSGDKGDTCNIGVIARNDAHFDHLCKYLTADVVRGYFAHYIGEGGNVHRYLLPGIHGMNFVLTNSLGGGGIASLRVDPQAS